MYLIIFSFIFPIINSEYFSTATPYSSVSNLETESIFPNNYKIVYVRYIGRHGSRFMSTKNILKTLKLATKFKNSGLKLEHFNLSDDLYNLKMEKQLSERGEDELYSIGKRYMERFSKIPGRHFFRNVKFGFESTCKDRSWDSMKAFFTGMFENTNESLIHTRKIIPCESDTLYRFYDHCETYKSLHDCLDEYKIEEQKFLNKSIIINITLQINRKLKFKKSDYLTPGDIKTLYILCSYKRIVKGNDLGDWPCSLFNDEALNAFEYLLDLKQYYKKGNAHKINFEMSCPLFKRVFKDVKKYLKKCDDDYLSKQKKIMGTFGFSHAETILPLIGSFGLFDSSNGDQNKSEIIMNSENFEELKHNRTFRTAYFSPMGGNIMFAVACPIKENEEGVVMVLLNEKPIPLPCCKPKYINNNQSYPVCTKKEFVNCFTKKAQQCNFLKICSTPYECKN